MYKHNQRLKRMSFLTDDDVALLHERPWAARRSAASLSGGVIPLHHEKRPSPVPRQPQDPHEALSQAIAIVGVVVVAFAAIMMPLLLLAFG